MLKSFLGWYAVVPLLLSSNLLSDPVWPSPSRNETTIPRLVAAQLDSASSHVSANPSPSGLIAASVDALRQQELCILWTKRWAGQLGRTLLFQVRPLSDRRVAVGYFAYWSTERPWGDNDLTRWVVPAIAIDAFYSHLFFVLPGMQRLLYGSGDVEGLRVTYDVDPITHRLSPVSVIADNDTHREVQLKLQDVIDDGGRILVYADTWSHQLGGAGALSVANSGAMRQCYRGSALQPITRDVADAFNLGSASAPRRAKPAWRLAAVAINR